MAKNIFSVRTLNAKPFPQILEMHVNSDYIFFRQRAHQMKIHKYLKKDLTFVQTLEYPSEIWQFRVSDTYIAVEFSDNFAVFEFKTGEEVHKFATGDRYAVFIDDNSFYLSRNNHLTIYSIKGRQHITDNYTIEDRPLGVGSSGLIYCLSKSQTPKTTRIITYACQNGALKQINDSVYEIGDHSKSSACLSNDRLVFRNNRKQKFDIISLNNRMPDYSNTVPPDGVWDFWNNELFSLWKNTLCISKLKF